MKPNIWIFSLEPLETRYTAQWSTHVPELLSHHLGDKFNVIQIDGVQNNSELDDGAFLNFSDTNFWKSSQLCRFLVHYNSRHHTHNDHFIFTDAWNPAVIQLKYMNDLLGMDWKFHGLWHAGSYDPADFLGRLVGDKPWVRNAEKSMYHAFDHNYFATDFHIEMFFTNLLNNGTQSSTPVLERADVKQWTSSRKIVRTGWPMEYMEDILAPYKGIGIAKRDLIVFPHRVAPEKQVEIFRQLAKHLPEYEFVVCQDQRLSKNQYHTILGKAKMVFSCSLQETLGIGCYEGAVVGAMPLVPNRLSYSEMYYSDFKYPSNWTENFESFERNLPLIVEKIRDMMNKYDSLKNKVDAQALSLSRNFFSASKLIKTICP